MGLFPTRFVGHSRDLFQHDFRADIPPDDYGPQTNVYVPPFPGKERKEGTDI